MKYLKSVLMIIIPTITILLISSSLCYFDIVSNNFNNILNFIAILLSSFIGGIYIGSKSSTRGYLEGLKIGGGLVLFLILLSYLGFSDNFSLIKIVYYLLLLMMTVVGSIIGINKFTSKK